MPRGRNFRARFARPVQNNSSPLANFSSTPLDIDKLLSRVDIHRDGHDNVGMLEGVTDERNYAKGA